jgi:hypothetical protein
MCFGDVGMEVLSDLVCRLSAEVGLDKSLAISHDTTLAAGSGEDKGDDLCGNGEESVSGCRCPATSEALVGLAIIACAINSRYISAQWQSSSCWSSNSSSVHPVPLR